LTRIADFIEQSNQAADPGQLFSMFEGAMAEEGCPFVAYGSLTNHVIYNAARYEAPAVVLNYPDEWVTHYFESKYQEIDPIVLQSPSHRSPYLWADLDEMHGLLPEQQRFMDEADDAGLKSGMTVPLHGPFGEVAVISLARDILNDYTDMQTDKLAAMASQFHIAYTELVLGIRRVEPPTVLTPRERECLLWSARGKSSWDIGMILKVSEHTVNFHLKNAMNKLECSSRVVAVVKAIRMGFIVP
jgi:LuxR family quorum-sensing system transcriptional regulator CciR|tara:strand:+ start:2583 stop:3314 length:732 start_codon:yes stop_codon:yes gene_type:complete